MSLFPRRLLPVRNTAVLMLAAAAVAGCAREGEASAEDLAAGGSAAGSGTDVPNLYLDRSLEFIVSGTTARGGYLTQLERCQAAGMPTVALSEADTQRIGTGRRQYWRTADAVATREERWEMGMPSACHFELRRVGHHAYFDAAGAIYLDLETGDVTSEPYNPEHLSASPVEKDSSPPSPGWTGPTMREIAGQPCEQWASGEGSTVCAWAGGTKWGYSPRVTSVYDGSRQDVGSLVLDAAPPAGKTGIRVSTDAFIVGGELDRDAMRPAELEVGGEIR